MSFTFWDRQALENQKTISGKEKQEFSNLMAMIKAHANSKATTITGLEGILQKLPDANKKSP